ncbi:HD domain-containing protein [Clostridium massiliamazoniense]|uniref:HD domain-containing protein n=1 Tax=Clostridium massiliamazoniense TaxID=1347366 RepID=UPI0006D8493D|nr:HD domain-containing protein [Clostridium massiliamazoniense]
MESNLFKDVEKHLLEDRKPSEYIKSILHKLKGSNLEIIVDLEKVEQNPVYHPEGNVLNHTLLVVDGAAIVRDYAKDKRALMWAAFLHDIGKKRATKRIKNRIVAYKHDIYGRSEVTKLLDSYEFLNNEFKNKVENLVGYHMHGLYMTRNLPFGDFEKMVKNVELHDIALLFFADKMGKGERGEKEIKEIAKESINIVKQLEEKYNVNLNETIDVFEKIIEEYR